MPSPSVSPDFQKKRRDILKLFPLSVRISLYFCDHGFKGGKRFVLSIPTFLQERNGRGL